MEATEDKKPVEQAPVFYVSQKRSPIVQKKLDEVNAHFARTDMSKLFQLIDQVKSAEKAE